MKFKIASIIGKKPELEDSAFSQFIRKAPTAEKKKVYRRVLEKATERQKEVLRKTTG